MKLKHIYISFFSLFCTELFSQESVTVTQKYQYEPNFVIGVDVLNLGVSFFSDRKVLQGFISSRVREKMDVVADLGFEQNIYDKNGYDAKAAGPFLKLGALYWVLTDPEHDRNGFYVGGKIAGSFYRQTYAAVPIRGYSGSGYSLAFPRSNQSSYWIEGTAGGRVQLFDSNFYIDMNIQPRFLVETTKQEDIKPMIVPGFGKSSGKFNLGFMWNIAYQF